MSVNDQAILVLLERIAIALEAMGGQKQESERQAEKSRGVIPRKPLKMASDEYKACLAWAKANGAPGGRAEKAIAKAGIMAFDEVTYKRLADIKNCGDLTIMQLLEWAESKSA
jgi:hypothetical protein